MISKVAILLTFLTLVVVQLVNGYLTKPCHFRRIRISNYYTIRDFQLRMSDVPADPVTYEVIGSNSEENNSKIIVPEPLKGAIAQYESMKIEFRRESPKKQQEVDSMFYLFIALIPIFSFQCLDSITITVRNMVLAISAQNWLPVDGGRYMAEMLTPTINGVVLPTISITLGVLVSNTISSLKERQNRLRECVNNESFGLKLLRIGKYNGAVCFTFFTTLCFTVDQSLIL